MNDATITIPCHLRTIRSLDQPIVFAQDGKAYANSEDVAAFFSKQHSGVLRAIRTLIQNDRSCECNFAFTLRDVSMPAGGARQVSTCNMNRDGFTLLAMGFTGKRALTWKMKYIEAFNAMETELAQPKAVFDSPARPTPTKAKRHSVDLMDDGLDLLMTAEAALAATDWHDARTVEAIRNVIGQALKILAPVRERVNQAA